MKLRCDWARRFYRKPFILRYAAMSPCDCCKLAKIKFLFHFGLKRATKIREAFQLNFGNIIKCESWKKCYLFALNWIYIFSRIPFTPASGVIHSNTAFFMNFIFAPKEKCFRIFRSSQFRVLFICSLWADICIYTFNLCLFFYRKRTASSASGKHWAKKFMLVIKCTCSLNV